MPVIERAGKPRLHYTVDDYTDPWKNAPFVILQHGNGRSSRFWYSWVPYLSRHYRVVRPDARGLGASSADFDLERELTVESLVEDLIAVLDGLSAESVHFCGESMGGILGLALAALHPERVRTLTLVSTPVYISDRMKESYSMGHKSRVDAMKEMGREAWLKATNRSTRFPPDTEPALLDWYEAEFARSSTEVQLAFAKLVNGANAASFPAASQGTGARPLSHRGTDHERRPGAHADRQPARLQPGAPAHALSHGASHRPRDLRDATAALHRAARRGAVP